MGQTSDSVDWVGALFNAYGVVMVDAKDNIKINSDETRAALEYAQEADGGEFRRRFTPGTMPATTAGSFPARDRAS